MLNWKWLLGACPYTIYKGARCIALAILFSIHQDCSSVLSSSERRYHKTSRISFIMGIYYFFIFFCCMFLLRFNFKITCSGELDNKLKRTLFVVSSIRHEPFTGLFNFATLLVLTLTIAQVQSSFHELHLIQQSLFK